MKKIKNKKNFLAFAEILWAWSKQLWRSDQTPSTDTPLRPPLSQEAI